MSGMKLSHVTAQIRVTQIIPTSIAFIVDLLRSRHLTEWRARDTNEYEAVSQTGGLGIQISSFRSVLLSKPHSPITIKVSPQSISASWRDEDSATNHVFGPSKMPYPRYASIRSSIESLMQAISELFEFEVLGPNVALISYSNDFLSSAWENPESIVKRKYLCGEINQSNLVHYEFSSVVDSDIETRMKLFKVELPSGEKRENGFRLEIIAGTNIDSDPHVLAVLDSTHDQANEFFKQIRSNRIDQLLENK